MRYLTSKLCSAPCKPELRTSAQTTASKRCRMPVDARPVRTFEVDPPLATAIGIPRALAARATATTASIGFTCAINGALQVNAESSFRVEVPLL